MKYNCIRCESDHEMKLKEVLGKKRISCPDCGFEMIKVLKEETPIACPGC